MDLGLGGRVAFITGASSGLGYAVARELLLEGCQVAICSRSKERIDQAAETLSREFENSGAAGIGANKGSSVAGESNRSGGTGASKGPGEGGTNGGPGVAGEPLLRQGDDRSSVVGDVLPIVCDVTDESSIRGAISSIVSTFGRLNILVTNAGGPPAGFIDDFSADAFRGAIELNLISTINLCRAALPHLREAAREPDPLARILMITSVAAKQPIPNLYLSNTARAGVQGFAKSLSEELGPEGINVNTILPGYTRTDRLNELADRITQNTGKTRREVESEWSAHAALKRLADPSEFAAAAAFLVSKRASYVTGTAFPVDGGRVKHLL